MLIEINTDSSIEAGQALSQELKTIVEHALERFSERITRVKIHLSDENSARKPGVSDKRCLLEARLAGVRPIAVSHQGATLEQAVDGAAKKLRRSLDGTMREFRKGDSEDHA